MALTRRALWILASFILPKAISAGKFLLAARVGGPVAMGHLGECLVIYALVEGVTDFGLAQAFVQTNRALLDNQVSALWTLSIVRGGALAAALAVSGYMVWAYGRSPNGALIAICGATSMIRSTASPSLWRNLRELNFKVVTVAATLQSCSDFTMFILLLALLDVPVAFVLATSFGELSRVVYSYLLDRRRPRFHLNVREIAQEMDYSREVWQTNILSTLLNQADKVITVFALGAAELGRYQATSRMAQYALAEPALAYQSFLFPAISKRNREGSPEERSLDHQIEYSIVALTIFAGLLVLFHVEVLAIVLGPRWKGSNELFSIFIGAMLAGAITAILVAIARGQGLPSLVKRSAAVQMALVVCIFPVVASSHNAQMLAVAYASCLWVSTVYLYHLLSSSKVINLIGIRRKILLSLSFWTAISVAAESTTLLGPRILLAVLGVVLSALLTFVSAE